MVEVYFCLIYPPPTHTFLYAFSRFAGFAALVYVMEMVDGGINLKGILEATKPGLGSDAFFLIYFST